MSIYKGTEFIAGTPDMAGYVKTSDIRTMLATLYPVGSIYIGTQSTCPLATLISGSTWKLVSGGRVLQGADSSHSANSTIAAGLPNITGNFYSERDWQGIFRAGQDGAFNGVSRYGWGVGNEGAGQSTNAVQVNFNASRSSSIYGSSSTVQPPAYVVNIWRRTA